MGASHQLGTTTHRLCKSSSTGSNGNGGMVGAVVMMAVAVTTALALVLPSTLLYVALLHRCGFNIGIYTLYRFTVFFSRLVGMGCWHHSAKHEIQNNEQQETIQKSSHGLYVYILICTYKYVCIYVCVSFFLYFGSVKLG